MLYRKGLLPIKNRFLIVRHGESIWNKDSKFTGWTNIPLTNNGRKEASLISHLTRLINPSLVHQKILSNLSAIAIPSPPIPYLVSAHQSLSARDDLLPHIAKPIFSTFSSSVFLGFISLSIY